MNYSSKARRLRRKANSSKSSDSFDTNLSRSTDVNNSNFGLQGDNELSSKPNLVPKVNLNKGTSAMNEIVNLKDDVTTNLVVNSNSAPDKYTEHTIKTGMLMNSLRYSNTIDNIEHKLKVTSVIDPIRFLNHAQLFSSLVDMASPVYKKFIDNKESNLYQSIVADLYCYSVALAYFGGLNYRDTHFSSIHGPIISGHFPMHALIANKGKVHQAHVNPYLSKTFDISKDVNAMNVFSLCSNSWVCAYMHFLYMHKVDINVPLFGNMLRKFFVNTRDLPSLSGFKIHDTTVTSEMLLKFKDTPNSIGTFMYDVIGVAEPSGTVAGSDFNRAYVISGISNCISDESIIFNKANFINVVNVEDNRFQDNKDKPYNSPLPVHLMRMRCNNNVHGVDDALQYEVIHLTGVGSKDYPKVYSAESILSGARPTNFIKTATVPTLYSQLPYFTQFEELRSKVEGKLSEKAFFELVSKAKFKKEEPITIETKTGEKVQYSDPNFKDAEADDTTT